MVLIRELKSIILYEMDFYQAVGMTTIPFWLIGVLFYCLGIWIPGTMCFIGSMVANIYMTHRLLDWKYDKFAFILAYLGFIIQLLALLSFVLGN